MKLSIHRALAQLKTTRARIEKEISSAVFLSSTMGRSGKAGAKSVPEMEAQIRAEYKSIEDLMKNFCALKYAITRSNSGIGENTTNVSYADEAKHMTVAEVIAYQVHALPLMKQLLDAMVSRYDTLTYRVEKKNAAIMDDAMNAFAAVHGGKENTKDLPKGALDDFVKTYVENNGERLVDPLDLRALIARKKKEYDNGLVWADATLSEANALRTIDVEL